MSDDERFQAALAAKRRRRSRPALPYQPVSARRLIRECRSRLNAMGVRGPRCFELIAILVELLPQVQSGVAYKGDVGMAGLMHRCSKTAHRAKYDLLRCGLVRLHCSGPKMCPCAACGGQPAGGKILNARGQLVSAATGYELDPALLSRPNAPRPGRKQRAISTGPLAETPAQRRLREQGLVRMQDILGQLRPRPGP